MPNAGMRAFVPPIPASPSPHGLLGGCIPVVTTTDLHELNGTDMMAVSCANSHGWQDCPDVTSLWTNPAEKTFERIDSCSFNPITAQAGIICSPVGFTYEESRNWAFEALALGEQFVLEDFFMRTWLTDARHTTDLTPLAGAVHIVNGIGLLETWLATEFGGQGVIHAPIGTAALLSMHTQVDFGTEETCPTTLAGNSVVLGAGYSANLGPATPPAAPVAAPAGEAWLYITPSMRIRRDTPFLAIDNEASSMNTAVNDRRMLAETTFVPEVACCMAAAVRVTLSACC